MKKVLINFATSNFKQAQILNSQTGKEIALFDEVITYSPKDIDRKFYKKNRRILWQLRGSGYWLWKPYFIKRTLETLNNGDFLFYCDSGSYFLQPINLLIDLLLEKDEDIMTFELSHFEKTYTKRDAFILMNCDTPKYTESRQRLGSFQLWKKTKKTLKFLNEYLHYCQDERIITDSTNQCGKPNYSGFVAHRHDQSIFSVLAKKYDLTAYRDPSQFGNSLKADYPNSPYDQIIHLTREQTFTLTEKVKRRLKKLRNKLLL